MITNENKPIEAGSRHSPKKSDSVLVFSDEVKGEDTEGLLFSLSLTRVDRCPDWIPLANLSYERK